MRLKPRLLLVLIISSFLLLLMTNCGASEPTTALGFTFWISFGVFAFCCVHLAKNEDYYKNYMMNSIDNMCLYQLYDELERLIQERKDTRQYHKAPEGYTVEEYLQEIDEEETYIRMKIEELSIVQDDFMDDEF